MRGVVAAAGRGVRDAWAAGFVGAHDAHCGFWGVWGCLVMLWRCLQEAMESDCWTGCTGQFSSARGEKLLLILSVEL